MRIHVIRAVLGVILHHEYSRVFPVGRVGHCLDQTAQGVVVARHLRQRIFQMRDVRGEVAEMIVHEIDNFEVGQIAVFHILIEFAIPLFKPVLIRSIQVPAPIVDVGVILERRTPRHPLHCLLREGIAHNGQIERISRRRHDIIILVVVETVVANRLPGTQHRIPDIATERTGVEIISALGGSNVLRPRLDGRVASRIEQRCNANRARTWSSACLVGHGNSDIPRISIPVERYVEVCVAIADEHILHRGIVGMALHVPVPAVAAYIARIVEIVEQRELRRQTMMVGRDGLGELYPARVAVTLLQIAKHLVVGSVLFLNEDHVLDVIVQERHHRILARVEEAVVRVDEFREVAQGIGIRYRNGEKASLQQCENVLVARGWIRRRAEKVYILRRYARAGTVGSIFQVGAGIGFHIYHVQGIAVGTHRHRTGIPAGRNAAEQFLRRHVDNRYGVFTAQRNVKFAAVGAKRQGVGV